MPPIVTVTLNPAIDASIVLDDLRPGHVHRARAITHHAGGKGVNVASCLADWGLAVTATGLLGAANAGVFETLFATKRITDRFIRIPGETRTNFKLSHGETTDINLPGLVPDAGSLARLRAALDAAALPGALVLLAGSLPAGMDAEIYAELIKSLTGGGARVILDTSGAPLRAALNAADPPFCIKPNRAELEVFAGRPLAATTDLLAVARDLRARGVGLVVISLGEQGALFIGDDILTAALPVARAASTVGAGDAMVAGIIAALADGADLETIARRGTAFAVAKLGQAGPNLPARRIVEDLEEKVTITQLEGAKI